MKITNRIKSFAFALFLASGAVFTLAPHMALAAPYTANEYANIDCNNDNTINAAKVRFSQDSIASRFSTGETVQSLIDELIAGTTTAADVPPIRLVKVDPSQVVKPNGNMIASGVYTLDNRRLYAFQSAGKAIRCSKTGAVPGSQKFKFTTDNNGTSITVR